MGVLVSTAHYISSGNLLLAVLCSIKGLVQLVLTSASMNVSELNQRFVHVCSSFANTQGYSNASWESGPFSVY